MTPAAAIATVAAGGALGAVLRWWVSGATARALPSGPWEGFPLGTIVVNVVGCFLLAWLASSGDARGTDHPALRLFLGTGLLGALTTFSTFGLDGHGLLTQGRTGQGLLYLGGTLVLAGAAVLAGWAAGR